MAPMAGHRPRPHPALPEAPASVNCHITIAGRQVQLTPAETPTKPACWRAWQAVLAQYPVQAPASTQGQPRQGDTPQCPQHGALKQSKKGKGWYCPNRLDDDTWCPCKGT